MLRTTKPGITLFVTLTSLVGLTLSLLAHREQTMAWAMLARVVLGCALGTALSAAGANTLNQWLERGRDALMRRTENRPLPRRMISPAAGLAFGIASHLAGLAILLLLCGLLPAVLAAACGLIYVLCYTPLKARTTAALYVGTIPGALPPLIGWTSAAGAGTFSALLEPGGLSLAWLMTVWQIPHFLAIGWMYREDYARAGLMILPVVDREGRHTARGMLLWSGVLLPATLGPAWAMPWLLGLPYTLLAVVTGLAFVALNVGFARRRDRASARRVFLASIAHLPLVLVAMIAEAIARSTF